MSISNDDIRLYEEFNMLSDKFRLEKICKLTTEKRKSYNDKLAELERVHKKSNEASNQEKGEALEDISVFLLEESGGLFDTSRNIWTSTNEIDVLVKANVKGNFFCNNNIIDPRFSLFISECKNHAGKVGVTHVGKFCSLLISNKVKFGIIFSYEGITGKGWRDATGLVKKFYLHIGKLKNRYCIIDFNIKDFKRISNGDNFFQIVEEQLISLQFDTDFSRHLSKHPAELTNATS